MACTVCGSSTPCGCGQVRVASSARCPTPNSGCCTPNVQSVPVPFYQCADPCQESHNERIVLQQFYTSIKVNNSWNIPGCGLSAIINVAGLKSFVPGSYIWNPTYGYFEGTAFDAATGDLTIVNHCNDGNAAAGTGVPSCTNFDVTVPPCSCPDTTNTCVAIDFTAPDIGDCIDITLTNTNGLRSSDVIEIGSGQYFVSAVKANNIITICNQGDGITPGTPVIAKDSSGNYQYCISIISVNPCDADPGLEGKVLVCNGSGESVPLGGAAKGYVLTLIDDTLIEGAYRPLGEPDCTTLSAVLNIISGTDTYANVPVTSSANFTVNDLIRIGNSALRAEVTGIPDGTHIDIQFTTVPGSSFSFSIGTFVCPIDCCEDLNSNRYSEAVETVQSPATSGTLTPGARVIDTPTAVVTITNPTNRTMVVHYTVEFLYGVNNLPVTDDILWAFVLYTNINAAPVAIRAFDEGQAFTVNGANSIGGVITVGGIISIPALSSKTLQYFGRYNMIAGTGSDEIDILGPQNLVRSSYIAVAL